MDHIHIILFQCVGGIKSEGTVLFMHLRFVHNPMVGLFGLFRVLESWSCLSHSMLVVKMMRGVLFLVKVYHHYPTPLHLQI